MNTYPDLQQYWEEQYVSDEHLCRWNRGSPTHDLPAMITAGFITRESVVLDLGCGTGTDALFFSEKGLRTIAVDWSAAALRIAEERGRKCDAEVEWIQADVLNLPIAKNTIDFITDAGCFHHIPVHQRAAYVAQVHRVLKPGGHLLLRFGVLHDCTDCIDGADLNRCFTPSQFSRGPLIQYQAASDAKSIQARMTLIQKL